MASNPDLVIRGGSIADGLGGEPKRSGHAGDYRNVENNPMQR